MKWLLVGMRDLLVEHRVELLRVAAAIAAGGLSGGLSAACQAGGAAPMSSASLLSISQPAGSPVSPSVSR